jgi:hypothetical protein
VEGPENATELLVWLIEACGPSLCSLAMRITSIFALEEDATDAPNVAFLPLTIVAAWRNGTRLEELVQKCPQIESLAIDAEFNLSANWSHDNWDLKTIFQGVLDPQKAATRTRNREPPSLDLLASATQLRSLTLSHAFERASTWRDLRIEEAVRIFAYIRQRKQGRPFEQLCLRSEDDDGSTFAEIDVCEDGPSRVVVLYYVQWYQEKECTCMLQVWNTDTLAWVESREKEVAYWPMYDQEGLPLRIWGRS